ncbi:MAG: formylglycine-generating enzyme family protein [Prevotellaceae bacterium]|jgi:formylglycine-generating enzyme required for sulfatase activity|nr:formylglycine-generating enzyme family protein [Prevotellaceae bacterium]
MKRILTFFFALTLTAAAAQAQGGAAAAGAQAKGGKPSLVVFVVGMENNQVGDMLAQLVGNDLNRGDVYDIITRTDAVQKKLRELRRYEQSGNVDDSQLIEWGRQNNVSLLCLITALKLDEHLFSAQLTDVKSNKLAGSGDYTSATLGVADLKKAASSLAEQLQGSGSGSGGGSHSASRGGGSGSSYASNARRHPAEPEMVAVQGGTFWMGCSQEQQGSCDADESPLHSVTVGSFHIGKYEVTQAQWKTIMGSNPSGFQGDNLPVENVSWSEAQEFISRLNAATGKSYRLPTEAEWEFAARGGSMSRGYKYSGSHNLYDVAWFEDNSGGQTHPVGSKKANELGIHDMSGNVYDWCLDWYGTYSASSQQDPMGASSGSYRVLRGGSWNYAAGYCRVASRNSCSPSNRGNFWGFRVVLP